MADVFQRLPRAPLSAPGSADQYNKLVDAVETIGAQFTDTYRRGSIRRGHAIIRDIFIGVTTGTPCTSNASNYTDARYYVIRSVTDAGLNYDSSGIGTDELKADNIIDDPFNGKISLPPCVTATNLSEITDETHNIVDGTPVVVIAFASEANPLKNYYVFTAIAQTCRSSFSKNLLAGSGTTANTVAWDINADGMIYDGVYVQQWTRTFWDSNSDTLYGFYRSAQYDSCGKLINVTGETRYTIFTASDCGS